MAHQAEAYPGFCSIKRVGILLLPPGEKAIAKQKKKKLIISFSSLEICKHPLGMQNRRIPNHAVTASSSWDANHAPYLGRLHFTARGKFQGAWSSRYNNHFQFFQVDFRKATKVSHVATQGRQNANQWVTQYRLAYSQDGVNWALYKLRDGIKVRMKNRI